MPDTSSTKFALLDCAATAQGWLFGTALPLWLDRGLDRDHGGFHEALESDANPHRVGFKRLRVATRQVYVFAEGARHGVSGAREAVDHGLDFIRTRLRHPDGGYASRCDAKGRIIDQDRDLYDLAFALFAFAHVFRLTAEASLREDAHLLLEFIVETLRHPAGGYAEGLPANLPRRQNPHMHLLEAALACFEHMSDPRFGHLCDELVDLCHERFLDPRAGVLFEYYDDAWQPSRPDGRALVEPGHHMEWVWLLAEAKRLRGRRIDGADALAAFALRGGRDPVTGFLRGALFEDGAVADPVVRLWPHCEWLKAALVSGGAAGDPAEAWAVLTRFLQTPVPGLWFERWDPGLGGFVPSPSPASSLYHITTAISALRQGAA